MAAYGNATEKSIYEQNRRIQGGGRSKQAAAEAARHGVKKNAGNRAELHQRQNGADRGTAHGRVNGGSGSKNAHVRTAAEAAAVTAASAKHGSNRGSSGNAGYDKAYIRENRRQTEQDIDRTALQETGTRVRYFYDTSLLCAVIFVFALGCLIIYSSSQYTAALERGSSDYYFKRQLIIGGAGIIAAIGISLFDYHILCRWKALLTEIAYWGSNALLLLTLVRGIASHGKARWINIFGIQFQPAEVAKIAIIVWMAWFISRKGSRLKEWNNMRTVLWRAGLPFMLIVKENKSSAIIVALIVAVMLFVALENMKIFAVLGGAALGATLGLRALLRLYISQTGYSARSTHYWMRRIWGWAAPEVFPDDAYQTLQSLYAIGSGGITGHGLGDSIQKFGKLPEAQNDMIFAIVCEEFGFIGAATIVLLYFYLIYRIYQIGRNASDMFGTMLCTGVMAHLGIQAVLNIAVVTGVIPNTGVTLPFISYGGSAVLFTMCEIGLVLSVAHRIPRITRASVKQ